MYKFILSGRNMRVFDTYEAIFLVKFNVYCIGPFEKLLIVNDFLFILHHVYDEMHINRSFE